MENIKIIPDSGGFIAEFKLRLTGKDGESYAQKLNQLPILKWIKEGTAATHLKGYEKELEFQSILGTIVSIIDDFPLQSFTSLRVVR